MKNRPEMISYKLIDTVASEASYASDALVTLVAFVQQRLIKLLVSKASASSNQTLYQDKNRPEHTPSKVKNESENIYSSEWCGLNPIQPNLTRGWVGFDVGF